MRTCAVMASGKMGVTSPPLKSTQVNTLDLLEPAEKHKKCVEMGTSLLFGGLPMTNYDYWEK